MFFLNKINNEDYVYAFLKNRCFQGSNTSVPSSYRSYYCGQGLGVDTNSTQPGVNGKGVRDFSGGPFQLTFHADGNTPVTDPTAADDTGFTIAYAVQAGKCK